MGRKQKSTSNLLKSIPSPTETQKIAKVLNGRGKNLFEIQCSDGSYVIINPINETERTNKIGGEILFPEHVKHLKSVGIWPQAFEIQEDKIISSRNEDTNSDDLFVNTNHQVRTMTKNNKHVI